MGHPIVQTPKIVRLDRLVDDGHRACVAGTQFALSPNISLGHDQSAARLDDLTTTGKDVAGSRPHQMDVEVGGENRLATFDSSRGCCPGCVIGQRRDHTGMCEAVLLSHSSDDMQLALHPTLTSIDQSNPEIDDEGRPTEHRLGALSGS